MKYSDFTKKKKSTPYKDLMRDIQNTDEVITVGMVLYIIARTILVIGITPVVLYILFAYLDRSIDFNVEKAIATHPTTFWIIAAVIISIILYFQSYKQTKVSAGKFLIGVTSLYIGHLGLAASYWLVFVFAKPGGFSGIFLIPPTLWMGLFYSIAFTTLIGGQFSPRLMTQTMQEDID